MLINAHVERCYRLAPKISPIIPEGQVLAYVFGRRKDEVFLKLKSLLEPFGITRYYTDG